jgi:CHAT domain-containing protein
VRAQQKYIWGGGIVLAVIAAFYFIRTRENPTIPFADVVQHFSRQGLSEADQRLLAQSIAVADSDSVRVKAHFARQRDQIRKILPAIIDQILLKDLVDSGQSVPPTLAELDRLATIFAELYQEPWLRHHLRFLKTLSPQQKRRKLAADYWAFQGDTLRQNQQPHKAIEVYARALKYYAQISDTVGLINAHYMIGYTNIGENNNESLESFKQCVELARKIENPLMEMRLLYWIGFVLSELRRYQESEEALQSAINLALKTNNPKTVADAKSRLGLVYSETGRLLKGLSILNECIGIYRDIGPNAKLDQAGALRRLGFAYRNLGDFARALDAHQAGLNIYQELKRPRQEAAQYTNLGNLYGIIGEHELSLKHHQTALDLFKKYGNKEDVAITLANVGEAYQYLDKLDSALYGLEEALHLTEGPGSVSKQAQIYQMIGEIRVKQKRWREAREMFAAALQINQDNGFRVGLILDHLGLGQVALATQQAQEALQHFENSLRLTVESSNSAYAWKGYYGKGLALKAQGEIREALPNFEAAIDSIETGRGRIEIEQSRLEYFAEKQEVYDALILTYVENNQDADRALDLLERAKARSFLDFLYGGANIVQQTKTIAASNQSIALVAPASTKTPSSLEIQAALGPQDKIIEYRVFKDRIAIWTVDREKPNVVSIPLGREELQKMVLKFLEAIGADKTEAFRRRVRENRQSAFAETLKIAEELSAVLIKPIWAELQPHMNLYIVPDDILHYLPFAALTQPAPDSQKFLIEALPLATAPSAAVLKYALEKRKIAMAKNKNLRMLAIADPLGDLPWARQEAQAIAALFPETRLLIGQHAQKSAVRQAIQEHYDVIDFGTHCRIDEKSPLYSSLALASPAPATQPALFTTLRSSTRQDFEAPANRLSMYEVFELNLTSTRLVVLSACETALGRFVRGEGLVGLTRAFMYAGVPTLITTLWKVDDKATARLMTKFYNNLKAGEHTVSQALRLAQIAEIESMRNAALGQLPHPYFWAPFIVAGNAKLN